MIDKLHPCTPAHRRVMFYALRTLFEGDTVVLSGVTLVYAVILSVMMVAAPDASQLSQVIDPEHLQFGSFVLVVLTLYQFVCHAWLRCPDAMKVVLGFLCFTAVASVSFLPYFVWGLDISGEIAGNIVVTIVSLVVATRSF